MEYTHIGLSMEQLGFFLNKSRQHKIEGQNFFRNVIRIETKIKTITWRINTLRSFCIPLEKTN